MKLLNRQVFEIHNALNSFVKTKLKTTLKFKMSLNIRRTQDVVDALQKLRDVSDIPGAIEFFRDRQKAQLAGGSTADIEAQHAKVVPEIKKRDREYAQILLEKIEISDLIKLPLDDFPEETELDISPLLPIIEE